MKTKILIILAALLIAGCTPETIETGTEITETGFSVESIKSDFDGPWGMAFINETHLLVTESIGEVSLVNLETRESTRLNGVPEVESRGQGGLLGIAFEDNNVYLAYSARNEEGIATHLGRGILNLDNQAIENFEVLFVAEPFMSGTSHFGSRILLLEDYLFLTTGDRGRKDFDPSHVSQDTTNVLGSVVRLYKDGSIPDDNPFIGREGFHPAIYTYGHRNIQGITLNPNTNEIWISEHGENDGDAIHVLEAGGNYGWPIAHHGCRYGTRIPVADPPEENPDVVNPVYYWECGSGGFPPAGMTFYDGDKFAEWQGNLFIGNLAGRYLGMFNVNEEVSEADPLLEEQGWRIRDVQQSPDGYLYVLTDGSPGMLLKLKPE